MLDYKPAISDAIVALGIEGGWKTKEGKIVKWWADEAQPTQSVIDSKLLELNQAWEAREYARNRADSYPSIQDVTVALAEKAEGDSTMWDKITAERSAVKSKFPKPE